MPSLLDLPPELRLLIYNFMTEDLGKDDPERTRSLSLARGIWFYHAGIDYSAYEFATVIKLVRLSFASNDPFTSDGLSFASNDSSVWDGYILFSYVIFEGTELASICSTCQLLRREALPILQNHARLTIK